MSADDSRPIGTMGFPGRVENALAADGIVTLGQLRACSETYLKRIPNLGYHSMSQIAAAIAAVDRGEPPPLCARQDGNAKHERNADVYARVTAGEPLAAIARDYGLANARIRQIFDKEAHRHRMEAQRVGWEPRGDTDAA